MNWHPYINQSKEIKKIVMVLCSKQNQHTTDNYHLIIRFHALLCTDTSSSVNPPSIVLTIHLIQTTMGLRPKEWHVLVHTQLWKIMPFALLLV